MNHVSFVVGNAASVISRLTCQAGTTIRAEKMIDCLADNYTGGTLWLMYFDNVNAVPLNGTTPLLSFPVAGGAGGTLGRSIDISGGIWVWSSTSITLTVVLANSGSIVVVLKG
jgi:hypothetical protein